MPPEADGERGAARHIPSPAFLEEAAPGTDPQSDREEAAFDSVEYPAYQRDGRQVAIRLLRAFTRNYERDMASRSALTVQILVLVRTWLVLSLATIVLAGLLPVPDIPDTVQVALIASAGAGLIGLLGTVIAYYFTHARETTTTVRDIFRNALAAEGVPPEGDQDDRG